MLEKKERVLVILAFLIGASGFGIGCYTLINNLTIWNQIRELDDISVYVINPVQWEVLSGKVSIDAIVIGSEDYSVSVFKNNTVISYWLPIVWYTEFSSDGWWNISVIIQDVSGEVAQDDVIVLVSNA